MNSRILLFIIGFFVWMLLGWPFDIQHALVGIPVAALVAFLTGDMFSRRPHHFTHITRYLWFAYYIPIFLWECLKANVDVALRVINPRLPINPGSSRLRPRLSPIPPLHSWRIQLRLHPALFVWT